MSEVLPEDRQPLLKMPPWPLEEKMTVKEVQKLPRYPGWILACAKCCWYDDIVRGFEWHCQKMKHQGIDAIELPNFIISTTFALDAQAGVLDNVKTRTMSDKALTKLYSREVTGYYLSNYERHFQRYD
jgi:hypothetical protein